MTQLFCTLVVEDEELYAQALGRELDRQGITCEIASNGQEAIQRVARGCYQVILLDHRLPDEDGIELIPLLLARQPTAAVLMMTAYHTIPNAVQAIRHGAEDYIVKETSIQPIIERVLEIRRRDELRRSEDAKQGGQPRQQTLLGRSTGMLHVVEQLHKIAKSPETTVLLTGETGVGKEVMARYLHQISRPAGSPMIVVDCLALPNNLAESLLFGHEKGAFTSADQARIGAFEEARDGTVFLDEIGDLDELQGKLLRVLETRTVHRVGSLKEIPLRARVVAATNRDLKALVHQGTFRLDLYQRLYVFPINIPPLRERGADILLLADHFRELYANKLGKPLEPLDRSVCSWLELYNYPGNVRELKNIIERAVIITESGRIEPKHLPRRVLEHERRVAEPPHSTLPLDFVPGIDTLETLEKRMITQALRRARNVKAEAARLLGISRYQLLRRLEKYHIQVHDKELG